MCVYIKILFFGQGQSSQGFIVISAALESQLGFNYFCVNIRKLVFKTDFAFWKDASLWQGNDMHKNAHIYIYIYSRELQHDRETFSY